MASERSSRESRERLIDEVRRFPVLYDTRHELHRDIDARDRCWAEIAAKLGVNSELIKREWKILRDSLRQSLRQPRGTTKAGAPRQKWRFQSRMAFLLPYMTKRPSRSTFREDIKLDMETEMSEPAEPEDCTPWGAEAAGVGVGSGGGTSELDALELFFASVCASARRLPPPQRRTLKRQVLDALLRCEADAEQAGAQLAQPSSSSDVMNNFKHDGRFC